MVSWVSLLDLAIDPGSLDAPFRVDTDRFRILAVHGSILPQGQMGEWKDISNWWNINPRVSCMVLANRMFASPQICQQEINYGASVLSKGAVRVVTECGGLDNRETVHI